VGSVRKRWFWWAWVIKIIFMKQLSEITIEHIKAVGKILNYGDSDFEDHTGLEIESEGVFLPPGFVIDHKDGKVSFFPVGPTFTLYFDGRIVWDYVEGIAGSLIILKAYDYLRNEGYEIKTQQP
jgi:hypothetical protein